jgi:hypothetical protein
MLEVEKTRLADDQAWTKEQQAKLALAQSRLDAAFGKLMQ